MSIQSRPTISLRLLLGSQGARTDLALRWQAQGQRWVDLSWRQFLEQVRNLSVYLMQAGLARGDRVLLAMPNSPDWEVCHHAILAAGCAAVAVDEHETDGNLRHMVQLSQARALICTDAAAAQRLRAMLPTAPALTVLANTSAVPMACGLSEVVATPAQPVGHWPVCEHDDLATIIFTSGSTGLPKAIGYSHEQICLAVDAITQALDRVPGGGNFACWMPLSNLFQRVANLWAFFRGTQVWFVAAPADVVRALPQINPVLFVGVPRFYEKLWLGIRAELKRQPGWKRALVRLARHAVVPANAGAESSALRHGSRAPWAHRILAPVRTVLGAQTRYLISGSAPLPAPVAQGLRSLGWVVLEAYGMSECIVPVAMNTPQAQRPGSVGRPLLQHQVKVSTDGELMVRGPGVCRSHWCLSNDPPETDREGYRPTGDFGHIDADGFVWITGRKSDVFKTSTGRRVAPVVLESCLGALDYVDHAVALGRNQAFTVLLLTLLPPNHASMPLVHDRVARDVQRACQGLPTWMQPAGVLVSRQPLSVDAGELTSNFKLRRAHIEVRFARPLADLYQRIQAVGRGASQAWPLVLEMSA